MTVTTPAATYTVGTVPVRLGSNVAGGRIINLSLTATVWASLLPGIQSGVGTPIAPGTSIQWTQPNDVFVILGNDTASLAAGSANVILSNDVSDWQPNPVAIGVAVATQILGAGIPINQTTNLLFNTSMTSGQVTGWIDVSSYQNLMFFMNGAMLSSSAVYIEESLDAATILVSRAHFTAPGNADAGSGEQFSPIGKYVRLNCVTSTVGQLVRLVGSTRQLDPNAVLAMGGDLNSIQTSGVLTSGVSKTVTPARFNRDIRVEATSALKFRCFIQDTDSGLAGPVVDAVQSAFAGAGWWLPSTVFPYPCGNRIRVAFTNMDAANSTIFFQVAYVRG